VWVGGQLTLAGLVPGLRTISADAPRAVARRFQLIAWPAFAILIVTGIWNIAAVGKLHHGDTSWWVTLFVKLVIVAASGITAGIHAGVKNRAALAIFGALTGVTALAALFFGVMLRGGIV
jgi:putative copper export protein